MKNMNLIFAFLPIAYAIIGYLIIQMNMPVLGVVMFIFSILFGLLAFMLNITNAYKKPSSH
jgi:hypothetical protein